MNTTTLAQSTAISARDFGDLAGRIFLATLFLLAGIGKLGAGYDGTAAYMDSVGVPGMLLPLVIALEIGGAAAIVAGYRTRLVALALAGFSLLSALLFHNQLADQMQFILFFKNVAIAGGFLVLAASGAGAFSVDARR